MFFLLQNQETREQYGCDPRQDGVRGGWPKECIKCVKSKIKKKEKTL
jgi:hypothetical protein